MTLTEDKQLFARAALESLRYRTLFGLLTILSFSVANAEPASTPHSLSFKRDVRPVLSNHCFACHGPDKMHREADVRLDVAGEVDLEEVLARIKSTDPDVVMPPPELNKPLKPAQVETLTRWIENGAPYEQHWAFVAPSTPELPSVDAAQAKDWADHPIDRFVLASLESQQLRPTNTADKQTLIRRLSLDLTGLPPSQQEIDAFLADTSDNAYELLVERLLNQSAYGEHLARFWLDLVRFADTNGLHHDHYREMTPYRDWVIRSFNDNLPLDDFIKFQIAGDLYADPTTDQQIASGFNRLHLIIDQGTALPEESFFRNVVDRVASVGTAFMGLTMQCAVCHDHKYDPITQKDFYQLSAFFNNLDGAPETGRRGTEDFKRGLQPPYLNLPTDEQAAALASIDAEIQAFDDTIAGITKRRDAAKAELEKMPEPAKDDSVASVISGVERMLTEKSIAALEQAIKTLNSSLETRKKSREALMLEIPGTLVMKERDEVRPTFIMVRGQYDQPGEEVTRNTPGFLPPLRSENTVPTRLDLAKWMTESTNPLTARVAVNRFWQQLFGVGLVKTSEDFGSQGESPSHPELLDFLTTQFVESGWNVKEMMRFIVTSKTYQQSSKASAELYTVDPANRLLARGSRFRLDAEVVRDQMLAVTGLLNRELYGKSVKPPQPSGIWETVAMPSSFPNTYIADDGDKVYRRSVYTFWKRAIPPPQMSIFDAPSRESCIARRERTNTPLQALLLMNESQNFEAAKHLAKSLLAASYPTNDERFVIAYETITCEKPSTQTLEQLKQGLDEFAAVYENDPESLGKMLAETDAKDPESRIELASWTMLVHSILNLDVTKTRE